MQYLPRKVALAAAAFSCAAYLSPSALATTVAPKGIQLTGSSYNFGQVATGYKSDTFVVHVTNPTEEAVTLEKGALPEGFSLSSTCGEHLAPSATCEMHFTFEPKDEGHFAGSLPVTFTNSAGRVRSYADGKQVNGLLFVGDAVIGGLTLTTSRHNFGVYMPGQTSSLYGTTLTNISQDTIKLSGGRKGSGDTSDFSLEDYNCPQFLAPGASCQGIFAFTPQAAGNFTDFFVLNAKDTSNGYHVAIIDKSSGQIVPGVTLSGKSTDTPGLSITTSGHNFGQVAVGTTSPVYGVVLYNNTNSALALNTSWSDSSQAADFPVYLNNCGSTIAAHQSCNLQWTFKPAAPQFYDVNYNIAATSSSYSNTISVQLKGQGVQ